VTIGTPMVMLAVLSKTVKTVKRQSKQQK